MKYLVGFLIFVLLIFAFLFTARVHVSHDVAQPALVNSRPSDVLVASPDTTGAILEHDWTTDDFVADIYPSQVRAAKRLGLMFVQQIAALPELPKAITLTAENPVDREALRIVGRLVRQQMPDVKLRVEMDPELLLPPSLPTGELWGVLIVDEPEEANARPKRLALNQLSGHDRLLAVAYVDKPWLENGTDMASGDLSRPGVIGRSSRPVGSERAALLEAQRVAADHLAQLVEARVRQADPAAGVNSGLLRSAITGTVLQGSLVRDRFVQSFDRPYGTVWRAAVLVDASPATLEQLALQHVRYDRARRETWAAQVLSIVGVGGVVLLLYVLLNAVTRGYFKWPLRTLAVAILLVVVALVVILA